MDGELILDATVDLTAARAAAARGLRGSELGLREILALSNDLLPSWDEEWLRGFQESFRILRVQGLEAACRTMAAERQYRYAVLAGSAAVEADPLCESAVSA